MNDKLEIYEIKIGLQDLTPISDTSIEKVLANYSGKDSIFRIYAIDRFPFINLSTWDEQINYNKILIEQVEKIKNIKYTEEEKMIYSLYAISKFLYNAENIEELNEAKKVILEYEKVISYEVDSDVLWFARQCIKYKLLDLYASWPTNEMYEKLKNLLSELKLEKDKYDSIFSFIWEKYYIGL